MRTTMNQLSHKTVDKVDRKIRSGDVRGVNYRIHGDYRESY